MYVLVENLERGSIMLLLVLLLPVPLRLPRCLIALSTIIANIDINIIDIRLTAAVLLLYW